MLILRVSLGLTFAAHGYQKRFLGGKIEGTAGWFDSIGMRPGKLHAQLASITEMGTGVMLALGLLHPFAAAGMVGVMIVAGYTVHRDNGFFIVKEGWEYTFIIAAMAIAAAGIGPGEWSLDHAFGIADDLDGWVGLAIGAGIGIAGGIGQLAAFYRPPAD
ncbi:MAG: DoxX family protein [Acidimicrobiales bacterium]|nr:DoxX family protein [Acidimicrobiales bacterium]